MPKEILNLETANKILNENMQNVNLRRHCYAVGYTLAAFYDLYKSENRDLGNLTKEDWQIIGILHDSDWEKTKDDPKKHTVLLLEWLENYNVKNEILDVFKSHNNRTTGLKNPETLLEWTLECCDELTGFIVAVALVMPDKKLKAVNVDSILKKFKQKEFSRAVDRSQIEQCENKISVPLEKFIETTLNAMQQNSDILGL